MRASTTPRAVWLAASLFAASTVLAGAGVVFNAFTPGLPFNELVFTVAQALLAVAFPAVGAVVAARHPRNACGWILIAVGVLQAVTATGYAYAAFATHPATAFSTTAAHPLLWLSNWLWFPSLGLLVTFLLMLFPDGHLPSRRWRPLAWATAVFLTVATAASAHQSLPLLTTLNPSQEAPAWLFSFLFGGLLAAGAGSVASLVVRFRRSSGVARQQLKWLAFGGVGTFAGVLLAFVPVENAAYMVPVVVCMLALPASIGTAMLRYRLFDIDRIISRTLGYLLLTGLLAAVYAGGVVLLHPVVSRFTGESQLAIAMSTIAVAALFRPARRRIQAAVDRRFNRARYDAQRVVEQFSADLRNQVDLEQLNAGLLAVVDSTVAPTAATLWLRPDVATPSSRPS